MEEALDWRGGSLPPGALVAIKDCVAAKGGFLLTFFLKKLLASTNPGDANNVIAHRQPTAMTRVLFVAIAEPFSHYHRVSKKQGCNLIACRESGQLVFLDMVAANMADLNVGQSGADRGAPAKTPLHRLYQTLSESVRRTQAQGDERTVIMIDDASLLEVIAGGRQDEVLSFLQYCKALYSGKHRCSVVVLVHGDTDTYTGNGTGMDSGGITDYARRHEEMPASLALELDHIADVVICVDPLATGLAADVHGQVTIVHWTDVLSTMDSRKGVQTLQFKLMENNTFYFHPGGQL